MKHLQAQSTLEQVFRRTTSILVNTRDANATRVLAFSVLDSLERMIGTTFEDMCHYEMAQKTLTRIEGSMSGEAQQLLLPNARRACDALKGLQSGFFMAGSEGVFIPDDRGSERLTSTEKAASLYLKMLRNATHGHGPTRPKERARASALLAQHSGEVHPDIALLAYLYLLELMRRGTQVRRTLYRRGDA